MKNTIIIAVTLFLTWCSVIGNTTDKIICLPELDVAVEIVVKSKNGDNIKTVELIIYGEDSYNKNSEKLNLSKNSQVTACLSKYERCWVLVDQNNDGLISKICVLPILEGQILVKKENGDNVFYKINRSYFISYLLGEIDIIWDKWPSLVKGRK
jgi:hypothetical protein